MWKYIAGSIAFGSLAYGVIRYFAGTKCKCSTRLDGLVIIVTGANSGIGRALSFELARRGATLILACRNIDEGIKLKKEILAHNYNRQLQVYVKYLDLNSFEDIIKFTECINNEFDEIYALVNNAGVFYSPQELTTDGFDLTFQTNYLGPFVLTHHLLQVLKRAVHSRIVNVVSEYHRFVNIYDLKALTKCQNEFRSHYKAYGVSKLALVLFTQELAKKLKNTNVIVNAVNPGNVETNIFRNFPPLSTWWLYALQWPIRLFVIKTPYQGAQTLLHALLTSNRSTGQYFSECKLSLPSPLALNESLSKEYYNLTLEVLDSKFITESEC